MSFGIEDLIQGKQASREFFFKHLKGLREDQWDWKPYPECKSIREIIAHLITSDRMFIPLLEASGEIDFAAFEEKERDLDKLMVIIKKTHDELCTYIRSKFADAPLDMNVKFMMSDMKLGSALAFMSTEDNYHTGQVAFIRIATDPSWDYYKEMFGM